MAFLHPKEFQAVKTKERLEPDDLVGSSQVALEFGKTRRAVTSWMSSGLIANARQVAGRWCAPRSSIAAFKRTREVAST